MHNLFQKAEPIESEMYSFEGQMPCSNKKADRGFPTSLTWHVCRGISHRKESASTARLDYLLHGKRRGFLHNFKHGCVNLFQVIIRQRAAIKVTDLFVNGVLA